MSELENTTIAVSEPLTIGEADDLARSLTGGAIGVVNLLDCKICFVGFGSLARIDLLPKLLTKSSFAIII